MASLTKVPKISKINASPIFQLKISLIGSDPQIWRRILTPGTISVYDLHEVIQPVMGWQNCHLFNFEITGVRYGDPDSDPDINEKNAKHFKLSEVLDGVKNFKYVYDFGDDWQHEIIVEDKLKRDENIRYPVCIGGENACPPEDCHGIHGYIELLKILQKPKHKEYANTRAWVGGYFDPKTFDPNMINREFLWKNSKS